jgi:hypothetical protein
MNEKLDLVNEDDVVVNEILQLNREIFHEELKFNFGLLGEDGDVKRLCVL